MYLLHTPVPEYQRIWSEFDELSRWMDLSPADRHFAWRELTSDDDWWEWPVPVHHFVHDPFYIGTDVLIRPVVDEFIADFIDPQLAYELFVFIGGIGAGKSFSASLLIAYSLYVLSCIKAPLKYLSGFDGVSMSAGSEIVLMNASAAGAAQASKIVYGEAFEKITTSPYFRTNFEPYPGKASELEFPNNIRLTPGTSKWQSALGFNIFAFVVDEAAFGIESERADYVRELFLALNQRRKSRFGRLGWGGLFTSPGSEHGYVELIAQEGGDWDHSILVARTTTWDAKDELKPGVTKVFLLDRDPDAVRVLESDLIFVSDERNAGGDLICQRANGEEVRIPATPQEEEVAHAA